MFRLIGDRMVGIEQVKFVELDRLLKHVETPIMTADSMILLLLYAKKDEPIAGRTLLFKELFLFYKEILEKIKAKDKVANPEFIGYKYGPFSFLLADILANLWIAGMVDVSGRAKGPSERFKLTKVGVKRAEEVLSKMPRITRRKLLSELSEKRIGWDQLSRDGIIRYVYNNYPEYTKMSRIKNRYKVLKWGQLFKE